jgi:anion-transporting  ArsA/GET3 family ATPase
VIAALEGRRLVICCGAGGVGKTTVSAALGLRLAQEGARAVVVTIDPARRLATALGMEGLSDEPRRVALEEAGEPASGELWALQLDAKATFDRLVARHAPDEGARDRILENRIYRHLSGAVAGAQEYMAVERLHELVDDRRFERIVLDTPPARNALDFLDAPQRITRFIEGRALRLLLRPVMPGGGIGWRVLHAGSSTVLSLLERLTGAQLLRDVGDFLGGFEGMYQGFADRAQAVRRLLLSPASGFVVVAAPQADPLRQAVALARRLDHDGFPLAGIVLNRVHPLPPEGLARTGALAAALEAAGAADPPGLAARAATTLEEEQVLGLRDLDAREALTEAIGGAALAQVPAMTREPVELPGLAAVAAALGPPVRQPEATSPA